MHEHTERNEASLSLEALASRHQELERRVAVLEHRLREVMARLTKDELDQFERVEQ